jgi:hypothetical protein
MASKGQMTGMLGVHLTAVELVKRGFIVSPTSRSAMGADLLLTDQRCHKAWSVQVKTNSGTPKFWLVGGHTGDINARSHVYVFVNVPKNAEKPPKFYVVPSRVVATTFTTGRKLKSGNRFHAFWREDKYENRWKVFGNPLGPQPLKKGARPKKRKRA